MAVLFSIRKGLCVLKEWTNWYISVVDQRIEKDYIDSRMQDHIES